AAVGVVGAPGAALPAGGAVPRALPRGAFAAQGLRPRRGSGGDVENRAGGGVPGAAGAPARGRGRAGAGRSLRTDLRAARRPCFRGEETGMDRPLRLITA